MRVMNAHDTPSGTRMMWNASVNAIWARAQGTGFTASSAVVITDDEITSGASPAQPSHPALDPMTTARWSEPAMPPSPPEPSVDLDRHDALARRLVSARVVIVQAG